MSGAVRVHGLRESMRAFRYIGGEVNREVRGELKQVGDVVRMDAVRRAAGLRMGARTVSGYRTRVRQNGVFVEQSRRKTTGQHPEFGSLQMRRVLVPARDAHVDDVVSGLEQAIERLGRTAGF